MGEKDDEMDRVMNIEEGQHKGVEGVEGIERVEGEVVEVLEGEVVEGYDMRANYRRDGGRPPYRVRNDDRYWEEGEDEDIVGVDWDALAPDMRAILEREPDVEEAWRHKEGGVRINHPQRYRKKKRTLTEREADLVLIARWYLEGLNHYQIADRLSRLRGYEITRRQVEASVHDLYRRWRLSYLSDINTLKVRELARIDKLESEYWDAWEKSKRELEEEESTRVEDVHGGEAERGSGLQSYKREKVVRRRMERDPNDKFLQGVQWCIEKRCQIFGLNAAHTVNINWRKQAEQAGIDPEALTNELVQQFIAAAMGGGGDARSLGEGAEED